MEPEQYALMARVERDHWWYVGMRRLVAALLADLPPADEPRRILDAGCGTGGNSAHLRAYGRVTGVDFSADALRFAAERPGLRLARASVESLPFADASFDLVLSNDVLCHLGVADDAVAACEFARVLRPGGVLLIFNFSYRGNSEADRADVARLAVENDFALERAGTRDFDVWDGATFLLRKPH